MHLGLALRASAALHQSDAVRPAAGNRVPVHGGCRRGRERVGRDHRRDADHRAEADPAGRAARNSRPRRQLRDRRVRRADDPVAAVRAQRCLAVRRAPAAAAQAGTRSGCAAAAHPRTHARRRAAAARSERRAQGVRRSRRRQ